MRKEPLLILMLKLIMIVSLIVGIGALCGVMGYYLTKKPAEVEISENKIAWAIYGSSDKSLFDWENYSLQYPNNWRYTEERIFSSRKLGALKTIFTDGNKQSDKLSIIAGGGKLDGLLTQNVAEVRFSDNTFYKYNGSYAETGQVYYIYKTGADEEINLGMETEIIFEFNNTDENTIKEILESFNLQLSEEPTNWKIYRNEEYGFEFKYPKEFLFLSMGPNEVQKELEDDNGGQLMSGTARPSFDTIIFSNEKGEDIFEASIFYFNEEIFSKENYIEKYFYLYGLCNASAGFNPAEINIFNVGETDIMEVKGTNYERSIFKGCYYFKNKNNNLIVISFGSFQNKQEFEKTDLELKNMLTTLSVFEIESEKDL